MPLSAPDALVEASTAAPTSGVDDRNFRRSILLPPFRICLLQRQGPFAAVTAGVAGPIHSVYLHGHGVCSVHRAFKIDAVLIPHERLRHSVEQQGSKLSV